jgi:hypothetical protein
MVCGLNRGHDPGIYLGGFGEATARAAPHANAFRAVKSLIGKLQGRLSEDYKYVYRRRIGSTRVK